MICRTDFLASSSFLALFLVPADLLDLGMAGNGALTIGGGGTLNRAELLFLAWTIAGIGFGIGATAGAMGIGAAGGQQGQ